MSSYLEIRSNALNLLARREHSRKELKDKLLLRAFTIDAIDSFLDVLEKEGILSDQRFTECYVRYRLERGKGPLLIKAELYERGIDAKIIALFLDAKDSKWFDLARKIRTKKFGNEVQRDFKSRAKEIGFLRKKGFTFDQIKYACGNDMDTFLADIGEE